MRPILLIISCISVFWSCSAEHPPHLHPNDAYALDPETDYIDIDKGSLPKWEDAFDLHFTPKIELDLSDDRYRIQTLTRLRLEEDYFMFIDGVKIQRIDFSGNPLQPLATEGRGPGELISPATINISNEDIVVTDRVNGLLYYDRKSLEPINPQFDTVKAVTIPPEDLCMMDDSFFIHSTFHGLSTDQKAAVFRTDSTFTVSEFYFHRYLYSDPSVVHMMTTGDLLCIPEFQLMAYAAMFGAPVLHLANVHTGKENAYLFSDMPHFYFDFTDGMDLSDKNYGTTNSRFRSNVLINDRFLIHQYSLTDRPLDPDAALETKIVSYVFDLENDFQVYLSTKLPLLLDIREDRAAIKLEGQLEYQIATFTIQEL